MQLRLDLGGLVCLYPGGWCRGGAGVVQAWRQEVPESRRTIVGGFSVKLKLEADDVGKNGANGHEEFMLW